MSKTKIAADLVLRYLTARALFRGTPWEPPSNLEYQIGRGVRALTGGVIVNEIALRPTPAIIDDRKDLDFWAAIIGGDDSVIKMDPEELAEWRNYVLNNGPISKRREPVTMDLAVPGRTAGRRRLTFGWVSGMHRGWRTHWVAGLPRPGRAHKISADREAAVCRLLIAIWAFG